MSVTRAQLGRGPANITIGGATLFTRDDFVPKHSPVWKPVGCTLHGQIDKYKEDFVIKNTLMVFGLWQSLAVLFPSYLLNPTVGTNIFGNVDQPCAVLARNGDRITYANSQITKMSDLYLGINSELFAATVEITSLIANGANPEDAGAYFVRDTAAYAETTFSKANFLKCRWTGAWGAKAGFGSMVAKAGAKISWAADVQPDSVDGLGTVLMYIGENGMVASCKAIPIGPTMAQVDSQQAVHAPQGTLLGAGGADLTWTGSVAGSVVLKGANITESSSAFGIKPIRVGETTWETTRAITAGVPSAVATVA